MAIDEYDNMKMNGIDPREGADEYVEPDPPENVYGIVKLYLEQCGYDGLRDPSTLYPARCECRLDELVSCMSYCWKFCVPYCEGEENG